MLAKLMSPGMFARMPEQFMTEKQQAAYDKAVDKIAECREEGGTELDLSGIGLTRVPPEIAGLTWLTVLSLANNQLKVLQPEIGRLKKLERLILEENALWELPKSLLDLPKLEELALHENDALGLPPEVLGPVYARTGIGNRPVSPADILHLYFEQGAGLRRPLSEVKLLVVGEGGVGKTSLIRHLLGEEYDPAESSTNGIKRHRLPMVCGRLGEVRLNVWDFGGQEFLHATHQLFFTHRSVYLLVLDSRQDERQSRVDYWLRLIAAHAGDSPVIVVCNKADEQVMELNWSRLNREYPQIKAIAKEVSCHTSYNEDRRVGLDELTRYITWVVEHHVGDMEKPVLASWLDLKDELEADGRDFITLDEYHDLAGARGITERRDREVLLRLMHQLGSMLHFGEHAIREKGGTATSAQVEDMYVVDAGWVTDAIYTLLNDAELIQQGGVMSLGLLRRILSEIPGGRHPAEQDDLLIAMMRRFEICFTVAGEGERLFFPDLLPSGEVDAGDWNGALRFRYQYRVLPGSVIGRLMVRLQKLIVQQGVWRTGVLFKRGRCEALVRSHPEDARLDVLIRGWKAPEQREFLELIRGTLEEIHNSFSGHLGVGQLLPAPGHADVFLDYEKLLRMEARGMVTEEVQVDGNSVRVNISDALNSVTERAARNVERLRLFREGADSRMNAEAIHEISDQPGNSVWGKSLVVAAIAGAAAFAALGKFKGSIIEALPWAGDLIPAASLGIGIAAFMMVWRNNRQVRFSRLFKWALIGWVAVNALGIAFGEKWKDGNGEEILRWEGALVWSVNSVFAIFVLMTGFRALRERKDGN